MWVRRSEADIREYLGTQERKRKSLLRPLIYGTIWGTLGAVIYGLGYRGGITRGVVIFDPHSRFDTRLLALGIIASVSVAAVVYYRQLRGLRFFESIDDALLCTTCFEPSSPNELNRCECGGELEPFEYYEWNEPEPATEAQAAV